MKPLDSVVRRALALHQQGQAREAEQLYVKVLKADRRQFDALHLLGLLKYQQGDNAEGLRLIGAALKIKPDYADALLNYGSVLSALQRHEEALGYFDRALAQNPLSPRALNNRGNSLAVLRRFDEALSCFNRALSIDPGHANTLVNRAYTLLDLGHYAEALADYGRALQLRPDDADSQMHMAFAELAMGNFANGWRRYEWRWRSRHPPTPRHASLSRWNGQRVNGTVLAWGEQGLGDEVIYTSMIPDLARYADSVVLEVEPRLTRLFARSLPEVQVIGRGEPLPTSIAAQSPLASLGQYLRPNWQAFPRREAGYLVADRDAAANLRRRLSPHGEAVVGLSWVSKSALFGLFKTAQLIDFASVLRLPHCRYADLQYGDTLAERETVAQSAGVAVERLADIDNTNDIDGLAALITACDLVVTVSNTTAHLAGALGKPTLLFVPQSGGRLWYWFNERADSPWYPHMHIRRQKVGQSWKDLVDLAADDAAALVKAAHAARQG
jgi:tetratricopeptide (TPR) repeat protein